MSLSEKFKQLEQLRKEPKLPIKEQKAAKGKERATKKESGVGKKATKQGILDRLGPKKKTLEERLGKTVVERLGKPLKKGTIVVGDHILGPKPKQKVKAK